MHGKVLLSTAQTVENEMQRLNQQSLCQCSSEEREEIIG